MVHDRFQVGDPVCGLVVTEATRIRALVAATWHERRCAGVVVYDVMAHQGAPQEWDPHGRILSHR